jgi:hypothetical protein
MGETKTKYVCRMSGDGVLPRKNVRLGDVVKVPMHVVRIEVPEHERGIPRRDKTQEESALPQGRGESLIAHLDSAVTRTTPRPTIQQQYNDQLGIYVQERQSKSTGCKRRTFNGSSKLRDGQRGSRRLCCVWIGWGD